jgi:hypothetical protein
MHTRLPAGAECFRRAPMITPASLSPCRSAVRWWGSSLHKQSLRIRNGHSNAERVSIVPQTWHSPVVLPEIGPLASKPSHLQKIHRVPANLITHPSPAIFPSLCLSSQQPPTKDLSNITQPPLQHHFAATLPSQLTNRPYTTTAIMSSSPP